MYYQLKILYLLRATRTFTEQNLILVHLSCGHKKHIKVSAYNSSSVNWLTANRLNTKYFIQVAKGRR